MEDRNYVDGIKFAKEHKNVVVLRTFSKIYGLAGAKIGYAIGSEEFIKLGFDVVPSETNFIYLDFHRDNFEVFEELLKRGIIIRPQYGTIGRISIERLMRIN